VFYSTDLISCSKSTGRKTRWQAGTLVPQLLPDPRPPPIILVFPKDFILVLGPSKATSIQNMDVEVVTVIHSHDLL
jgi:hypothetical protein